MQRVDTNVDASQPVAELNASYTAADIRVLSPEEAVARSLFAKTEQLCSRYPMSTPEFIERLVTAAYIVGFDAELAAKRYLEGDRTIAIPTEVQDAHRGLLEQCRYT